ncbi:dihydroorotase [Roseiflexus castenholzii]|uniref:dihydroorotase n=1 Tax=Roseiflexus castenholzii TaxID=120962 RepID=UPI003C7B0CA8
MIYTLISPLDMHIHFREGAMLRAVAPLSARDFAGGVIMPNLVPPVDNLDRLMRYRAEIDAAIGGMGFTPYMTLFFRAYSEAELRAVRPHIIGVKLYPAGVTTNSEAGVQSIRDAEPTLAIMEDLGIPLLVHGETGGFVLDREREFLPIYAHLARHFPRLTIVMEHITTREAVALLDDSPNLYATITLHHLQITLDDVAGGLLQPHLFCKPIAKRPEDRAALLQAALTPHPKVMFGSDSAPHPVHAKEAAACAAGVFSAPVALPLLAEIFAQHDALDRLQTFVSDNAQRIYGVTPPFKRVVLRRESWCVPQRYGEVTPYYAGRTIEWQVVQDSGEQGQEGAQPDAKVLD